MIALPRDTSRNQSPRRRAEKDWRSVKREEAIMNRARPWTSTLLLLVGGALLTGASSGAPAQAQDLRIGFIAPRTGIFSQLGVDMFNGFQMYLDEHKGELGGAKVTVILEDDQGKPDTGVTKANKLILSDKVHMLVGGVLATTGYALAPVATREKMLYIGSIATADDLGQRDFEKYPYMVRPTFVPSQPSHPLGQWACEQGYKRIAAIAADYAFGHETLGGFQKTFEDCGGKIVQKIWPPIGTKDFGPYIPTFKSDIDAIFTLMVGPMSLQFPKQLRAAGNKKPILGGGTSYDEFILPSMGDEVIGDVSSFMYSAALDTPKNREFVKQVPRQIRQGGVLLFGGQLHDRPVDRRDAEKDRRQVSGAARIHQDHDRHQARRRARPGRARRPAHRGPEHLHQESREEEDVRLRQGRALEHGDQDLSQRQSILDLRQGRVPQAAGLFARLPAVQILRIELA